jgi:hypothetical protein
VPPAASPAPTTPAPTEQVATQTTATPVADEVPMPKAKPDAIARTEPETTGSAPAVETERQAPVATPPAQESRSSRKSRDRRERQDARTNTRRDSREIRDGREGREIRDSRDTARANPERVDEPRGASDEPRATRSRGAPEQATRSTRSRKIEVDGDDIVVSTRNGRAREERRDEHRTVIERPAEPERSYAREDKPRLPFPFFFLGGNNND